MNDDVHLFKNMAPFPNAHHQKGGRHIMIPGDMKTREKTLLALELRKPVNPLQIRQCTQCTWDLRLQKYD